MREMILTPNALCPSVTVLYESDMKKVSMAGERGPSYSRALNVPPILAGYVHDQDRSLIFDGNHRAKEAQIRDIGVPCVVFETAKDFFARPEEFYIKITKGVLTREVFLYLFENAPEKIEEMYALGCCSVSSIRIEKGSFLERVKASRGLDFL